MVKSSLLVVPITLFFLLISSLLNDICCLFSPMAAAVLGLAAGALCTIVEKPSDVERSGVRGAYAGAIAGVAALIGQTAGGTIAALVIIGSGRNPVICLPGLCDLASAPGTQTTWVVGSFFSACFNGLLWLAMMAGLGAAGGVVWYRYLQKKSPGRPTASPSIPAG